MILKKYECQVGLNQRNTFFCCFVNKKRIRKKREKHLRNINWSVYFFQWVHQVNDKTISHSFLIIYETRQTWIRTISEECTKKTKDKNDVPKSAQKKPKSIIPFFYFYWRSFFLTWIFLTNAHNKLFSVCMFFYGSLPRMISFLLLLLLSCE